MIPDEVVIAFVVGLLAGMIYTVLAGYFVFKDILRIGYVYWQAKQRTWREDE